MTIAIRSVPFSPAQRAALDALCDQHGARILWLDGETAPDLRALKDAEALIGYFPAELFASLPALKWLQTPAAGVDKLCGDIYANPDVILTNCSGAFGTAIAEYMLTGLLMLMRGMPAYMRNQQARVWRQEQLCRSVAGSRITVVGMGDIGCAFARRAKALGAYVRGVRRQSAAQPSYFDEVYLSSALMDAVKDADAVALCLPHTAETRGIISEAVLSAMDQRAILINCGRGATVDQQALTQALMENRLAGAVLDVFETEPLGADSPLWKLENVIVTPHISGHDPDPINAAGIFAICKDNLERYLEGRPLAHVVDRKKGY